jgi:hypothetical protein
VPIYEGEIMLYKVEDKTTCFQLCLDNEACMEVSFNMRVINECLLYLTNQTITKQINSTKPRVK